MKDISHRFTIDLPPDDCWGKLRDLTLADRYVPSVRAVDIDTVEREGVGASRTVHLDRGLKMNETVVEWSDGQGFLLRLHRGEAPIAPLFSANTFRYAIEPEGDGTAMTLTMSYEPRGVITGVLCGLVAVPMFKRQLKEISARLKAFYETP